MYKFDEELYIEQLPAIAYRELVNELNNDCNWITLAEHVAEQLGLGPAWFKSLESNGLARSRTSPADNLLNQLNIRTCTVGILSDLLEDCNLLRALSILKQLERLNIIKQPNSDGSRIKTSLGTKIQLCCEATGLPPPSYSWYHDDTALNNEGTKELDLEINSVDQEGSYKCIVSQTDTDGTILHQVTSESVYIAINSTPIVIEHQPLPFLEIKKGNCFILSCKAKSHPEPVYQWFRDNTKLERQTFPILKIDDFNASDEGKYYCYIKNGISEVYTERSTVIMELPREKATIKIALLIANEDYEYHEKLKTPKNDVIKLSRLLEDLGFKVICFLNLNIQQMKNAMKLFSAFLSEGAYGLIYFAGHGFKMQESYILSVDAPKTYLRSDAICESELLAMILPKDPALLVVILDTCQTVPPRESNPDIHKEVPQLNVYRSRKNLRNLIQAYSTSSYRPSYERSSTNNGLYVTHLSKFITRDIPVQRVFEEVGKSIDTWFKGKERNQIPMFALTITKPYRLTDAVYPQNTPSSNPDLEQVFSFPSRKVDIKFQQSGISCEVIIAPFIMPFINNVKLIFQGVDDYPLNLHNSVAMERNNLFRIKNNEFRVHNPQMSKGPLVVSIEKDGNLVGASILKLMDYLPKILQTL